MHIHFVDFISKAYFLTPIFITCSSYLYLLALESQTKKAFASIVMQKSMANYSGQMEEMGTGMILFKYPVFKQEDTPGLLFF